MNAKIDFSLLEWREMVVRAVETIPKRLTAERLGYLTATSKVEGPIRDELAFALHETLEVHGFRVSREWSASRRDLAVLDAAGLPVVELEAKALYGFDAVSTAGQQKFLYSIKNSHGRDVLKLSAAIERGTPSFLLSLVTHPLERIPLQLNDTIKYSSSHNTAAGKAGSPTTLAQRARRWAKMLDVWRAPVSSWQWELGEVYGTPFALDCHLIGPLNQKSVAAAEAFSG